MMNRTSSRRQRKATPSVEALEKIISLSTNSATIYQSASATNYYSDYSNAAAQNAAAVAQGDYSYNTAVATNSARQSTRS